MLRPSIARKKSAGSPGSTEPLAKGELKKEESDVDGYTRTAMIVDKAQMLADFEKLLVIQATVEEALTEAAWSYGYSVEEVRSAANAKFGNLEQYAWGVANRS